MGHWEESRAMLDDVVVSVNTSESLDEPRTLQNYVEDIVSELPDKPYILRDLQDGDLFPLLRILKKIDIKEIKAIFMKTFKEEPVPEEDPVKVSGEAEIENVGLEIALDIADVLINNLTVIEDDIYELFSKISNTPVEKIKEMEFGTLPLMMIETFSKARNANFFKVLSKFL